MAGTLVFVKRHLGDGDSFGRVFQGFEYLFTDSDPASGVEDFQTTEKFTGAFPEIFVVFDATTPPDSLTITIKDKFGIALANGTLAASGKLALDKPIVFIPGVMKISCTGNSEAGAIAQIILMVM